MKSIKPKRRGPAPGSGGRPVGPKKVKMTVHVLPETAHEIQRRGRPGAVLDAVFASTTEDSSAVLST